MSAHTTYIHTYINSYSTVLPVVVVVVVLIKIDKFERCGREHGKGRALGAP